MSYQQNLNAETSVNLESLSDDQLAKIMDDIPKIMKKREAKADKEMQVKLRKEARANGYKVTFEKIQ